MMLVVSKQVFYKKDNISNSRLSFFQIYPLDGSIFIIGNSLCSILERKGTNEYLAVFENFH